MSTLLNTVSQQHALNHATADAGNAQEMLLHIFYHSQDRVSHNELLTHVDVALCGTGQLRPEF